MRAYLRDSSELVDLDDTSETLQQAVASNWVDLIVIIPDGFADDYVAAAADGDNPRTWTRLPATHPAPGRWRG